jgi:thiol-disulfide isomerase/thioredoxin
MIESIFGPGATTTTTTTTTTPTTEIQNQRLYRPRTANEWYTLLRTHRAIALYFTSQHCPPCRLIAPEFERLIQEEKQVIGVIVDTSIGYEIASIYQVRATPTFMFFVDGKKIHEFVGARQQELVQSIRLLKHTAYPPHPHRKLDLPTIEHFSTAPILFHSIPKVESMFNKLETFMNTSEKSSLITEHQRELLNQLKSWLLEWETTGQPSSKLPKDWPLFTDGLLAILSVDQLFPILDLIRLLLLTREGRQHYTGQQGKL